jgi:hypothetical protein
LRLDTTGRPNVVAPWLKSGRKYDTPPNIPDHAKYAAAWWTWWIAHQPEWREARKLLQDTHKGEKWSQLCRGGSNGIFMLILSLSWWLGAIGEPSADILKAIRDVSWVFDQLLAPPDLADGITKPSKRNLGEQSIGRGNKRLVTRL